MPGTYLLWLTLILAAMAACSRVPLAAPPLDPKAAPAEPPLALIPAAEYRQGRQFPDQWYDPGQRWVALSQPLAVATTQVSNRDFAQVLSWAVQAGHLRIDGEYLHFSWRFQVEDHYRRRDTLIISLEDPWNPFAVQGRQVVAEERADHPVVGLSWFAALWYCWALNEIYGLEQGIDPRDWRVDFSKGGYRLPSEAEWEYAAIGDVAGIGVYPWWSSPRIRGQSPLQPGLAYARFGVQGVENPPATVPSRRYPANGFGLYDMAGNVWEWTQDWYDVDAYAEDPAIDPRGPSDGYTRVLRGGSWRSFRFNLRTYRREFLQPHLRLNTVGLRPVRRLKDGEHIP